MPTKRPPRPLAPLPRKIVPAPPSGASPRAVPPTAAAPSPGAAATTGHRAERPGGSIVLKLVIVLLAVVGVATTANFRGAARRTKSQTEVIGTIKAFHERQSIFRITNQRFATWRELEVRGMRLPPQQEIVKVNATSSHWFVAVLDHETGLICETTGELFDAGLVDLRPSCREQGD